MKLVIDRKIYEEGGRELFAGLPGLELAAVPSFTPAKLRQEHPDAVIFRSNFSATENTLAGCDKLSFVATATAGCDNLDIAYLEANNISWAYSPGCNAAAVADYVLSCLAVTDNLSALYTAGKSIGLVGCGEVGSRIYRRLTGLAQLLQLKLKLEVYDPFISALPSAATTDGDSAAAKSAAKINPDKLESVGLSAGAGARMDGGSAAAMPFADFEQVAQCDIIVLACSLTMVPPAKASYKLFDRQALSGLSAQQWLINAARGEVIDEESLLDAFAGGALNPAQVILDVWPNEPLISKQLVSDCLIATPHIAGYSRAGKQDALNQVFAKFCARFYPEHQPVALPQPGQEMRESLTETAATPAMQRQEQLTPATAGGDRRDALDGLQERPQLIAPAPPDEPPLAYAKRLLLANYDPRADSAAMKRVFGDRSLHRQYIAAVFGHMRSEYPLRRQGTEWDCSGLSSPYREIARIILGQ